MTETLPIIPEIERGPGRPKGYFVADGTRVPSATTVAGRFKDPGGLYWWHWDRGRRGVEFNDYSTDGALDIGTLIHSTIEAEINDEAVPDVPERFRGPVGSAVSAWHNWFLSNNLTIIATEVPLVSEEYRFGGTIDTIVADRDGRHCIGDWKSSKAVYSDNLLQIAAYKLLWEENRGPITGGFHLVRFSKEHGDMEHRYYPDLTQAEELFVLLREAYDLDKALKARAK